MIDRTCQHCGAPFKVHPYKLREGKGKFCSKGCYDQSQTGAKRELRLTLEDRFWAKVDKRGPDECWPWLGSASAEGYGNIGHNGRVRRATHVAWELATGKPWPRGKLACHKCDNPPCVNPDHLFVGTKQTNADDMSQKGRSTRGKRRPCCRNGHPRTPENTYFYAKLGTVQCRLCKTAARAKQPGDVVL